MPALPLLIEKHTAKKAVLDVTRAQGSSRWEYPRTPVAAEAETWK